jgi:plastocyanin domain-containing protein
MRTSWLAGLLVVAGGCKEQSAAPVTRVPTPATALKVSDAAVRRRLELSVTENGFEPERLRVKALEPVTLVVTRKTDDTCATDLLIEGTDVKVALPLQQAVEVSWTPAKAGEVKFGCAMDMMVSGVLLVE